MALRPKTLRLQFSKGLSTETDEKTVVPGELTDLRNAVFTKATTLSKRWGTQTIDRTKSDLVYDAIAGARGGGNRAGDTVLVSDEDELVSFTQRGWTKRADLVPLRQSSIAIPRGPFQQYDQTHVVASNGMHLFAWADGRGGVRYRLFDSVSGSDSIVAASGEQQLSGHPTRMVRSLVVGTNFHMYFASGTTLNVAVFPYSNPTATPTFTQIATDLAQDGPAYDVIKRDGNAIIGWRNPSSVSTFTNIRPAGSVATSGTFPSLPSQVQLTGTEAGPALSLTDDEGRLVVAYGTRDSGALIKAVVYDAVTLSLIKNMVMDRISGSVNVTTGSIRGLTVVTDGGSTPTSPFPFTALYEVSASSPIERFVRFGRTDSTSSAPISSGTFRLQSSVASHAFKDDGDSYVWLTYPSPNQQTDFMYRVPDGKLCSVSRYAESFMNVSGVLERPQVTGTISYRAAPFRERQATTSVTASAFLDTSTRLLTTHIHRSGAYSPVDVEGRLFNGGGYLGVYDGTSHVESGFHLLSEPLTLVAMTGSTGLNGTIAGLTGNYAYLAVPSWTDSFGDTVRGYPVQGAQSIALDATHNQVAITGTMLVHTDKDGTRAEPIRWELYRTFVNDATLWQRVDDPNSPILNSTGSTYWTFLDSVTDGVLAGRQLFYAIVGDAKNAGELPNVNPPAPSVLSLSGDRLHAADCEGEPLTVFSSKLRLGGPVSFGLGSDFGVDPVGGPVRALAAMDDRLIVFKSDRIYVQDGFPITNLAADITPLPVPRLLTSNVGCIENHSIVDMAGEGAQGLMFRTPSKGIWLLGRNEVVADIGKKARRFDGLSIVSAVKDPLTQQVRFFSSEGTTLVYDSRWLEWSTFTGQKAIDAFIHRGRVAFVDSRGRVHVETPGSYLDNTFPVSTRIELSWLSFEGLQGLHRVYGIQVLGNRISDHTLRVGFARNYVTDWTYIDIPTSASMDSVGYGEGFYGGLTGSLSASVPPVYGGGGDTIYQHDIATPYQKVQSLRLSFEDVALTGSGGGFELTELAVEVGIDRSKAEMPNRKRF